MAALRPARASVLVVEDDPAVTRALMDSLELAVLAAQADEILSREYLAQEVWGYADMSNGRTIDVHIRRLRVKLANSRVPGPAIISIRGMGYRIAADATATTAA